MANKVLAIGDAHCPWMDKAIFSKLIDVARDEKPDIIIQMGDLYDLFSFSRWPKKIMITPADEIKQGREQAEEFWRVLQSRCPKAKCIQIQGNHDSPRIMKKVLDKCPEIADLLDVSHLWKFKNVKTFHNYKEEVIIDGIRYMHGHRSQLGSHARWHHKSVVRAHSHRAGIVAFPVFERTKVKFLFEMDVGFIADPKESALQYGETYDMKWTRSVGLITREQAPLLISL